MKHWIAMLVACLALGLVVAGCGDDDEDGSTGAATTEEPAETAAETEEPADTGGAAGGETVTVDMKDIQYVPQEVTVKAGGTIKWTNSDSVAHTVTKEDGPGEDFDSGSIEGGGTYEQKFTEPGEIAYVCTFHPNQTGTITVE